MHVRLRLPALAIVVLLVGACASPAGTTSPTDATTTPTPTDATTTPTPTTAESAEPTEPAEESAEPSAQPSEAASDELDATLASNFGSTDLTAGFAPDPFSVDLLSGGPIDVSYLGNGCRGFATAASDYDVTYTVGGEDLLRFYFVADTADTTLIINAPDGSWHCNDDAPDTIDPMVDFDDPAGGRYDIWIGSYESGTENGGTLYVTELGSNSP